MAEIAGLKLIVPSSVAGSGVSVSASGKVTFSSSTAISVNGCFTANYDNYLIVFRAVSSTNAGLRVRLRVSGSDASGSNYARQNIRARNTSVDGARSTGLTEGTLTDVVSTLRTGMHLYAYGPNLAQPTAMRSVVVSAESDATIDEYALTHSLSTSYDGISLYLSSGNLTGALCVYGLSQ